MTESAFKELEQHEDGHYFGTPCTCSKDCPYACKGACGCQACGEAYSDFMSSE